MWQWENSKKKGEADIMQKLKELFTAFLNDCAQFVEEIDEKEVICPECGHQEYSVEPLPFVAPIMGENISSGGYQKKCDNCGTIY